MVLIHQKVLYVKLVYSLKNEELVEYGKLMNQWIY